MIDAEYTLTETRRGRGKVFDALRSLREMVNRAWYQAEDKQSLIDEHIYTMRAIAKEVQKDIDTWERRKEVPDEL